MRTNKTYPSLALTIEPILSFICCWITGIASLLGHASVWLRKEKEGDIGDEVEVVRGKRKGDTRRMKGENVTGVKSMSEGSEVARPRWFWDVPQGERDQMGRGIRRTHHE